MEARQEVHEGGLARPRHADEGDQLALVDLEGDVAQGRLRRLRVAERHALEGDAVREAVEDVGAGGVHDGGWGVHDLEDALHRAE